MQTFAQTLTGRILKGALMSVSPSSHVIDLQNVTKGRFRKLCNALHTKLPIKVLYMGLQHGLSWT